MDGSIQTITLGGTEYVIVPRAEYERLKERAPAPEEAPDTVDAAEFGLRTLGESLRKARETAGLTQAELAARLGKSQPMVNGAESGRVRVGATYVKAVLAACGLSADWTAPSVAVSRSGPKRGAPAEKSVEPPRRSKRR